MRNFTMIEKIGAVHLIKFYGGESMKYPEVPRVKYPVLPKCGTEYWFNLISIDQLLEKIQDNKYLKVPFGTLIIVKKL